MLLTRRTGRVTAALLGAVMVVAGPFAVPAAQAQQEGKTLRVALVQEIDHLNPFTAGFASSSMIGRMNYEFLTLPSAEDATPTAGISDKWSTSEDKLTWTFHIRDGMKWSDGKPVTAKDAAYTFKRIMTDKKAQEANGNYVEGFVDVTASDDSTLVIKTKAPRASMTALDVPIVPEHIWSGISDMADPKTDTPAVVGVGDGPFLITEYRPNEVVKLKANPDYWRGKPKFDELQFVAYKNSEAAVSALKNGEVDFVNRLTPTQFNALQGQSNIATNKASGRRYLDLLMNPGAQDAARQPIGDGNPVLKDVRLRKAIATAIDPKELVDKVLGGYGEVAGGLIPSMYSAYHYQPDPAKAYKFDIADANRQLDAAGYKRGGDGVRTSPDGKPLKFRLTARSSEDFPQRTSEYLVGWLKQVGITIEKRLVSDAEVDEQTSSGNYDLALSSYNTNPDPDYTLAKQSCGNLPSTPGSGSTASFFCDPQFDQAYLAEAAETDQAKRSEYARQAQARYYDQAPSFVLAYQNVLEAYRSDKFTNFVKQPVASGPIMEQTGYWGFYGATPVDSAGSSSGGSTGLWIGIGVVVLVVLVGGGTFLAKRGKSADDRE